MTIKELKERIKSAEDEIYIRFNELGAEKMCAGVLEAIATADETDEIREVRAHALLILSDSIMRQGRADGALGYAQLSLFIAKEGHFHTTEARVTGLLGSIYSIQGDLLRAIEFMTRAVQLHEAVGNRGAMARNLSNIGGIYAELGDFSRSLEYLTRALGILEEVGDTLSVGITLRVIGGVYSSLNLHEKAVEYYKHSLKLFEEIGFKSGYIDALNSIGVAYYYSGQLENALEFYSKSLVVAEELSEIGSVNLLYGNIGLVYKDLGMYDTAMEYYGKSLIAQRLDGNEPTPFLIGSIGELYAEKQYEGYDLQKAEENLLKAIVAFEKNGSKQHRYRFCLFLSDLYRTMQNWEKAYYYISLYQELKDEVQSDEAILKTQKYDIDKSLAVERAHHQATDSILANILPPNITKRLLLGEKKIADTHENVSVLFVDIVGFTQISANLPAGELIDLLDIIFTRFDTICKHHGLEKIKTIGDAYMAVCGAPVSCDNHAERVALAALEMLEDFLSDVIFRQL
ncbi:MAG: tetratricopeptide repeat protein [Ignavibacteria bacterium]|nr:tetratricopeptide repeat protein [Ignavibacteria bacterium]